MSGALSGQGADESEAAVVALTQLPEMALRARLRKATEMSKDKNRSYFARRESGLYASRVQQAINRKVGK